MHIHHIGVITGGAKSQKHINASHAQEVGSVLGAKYQVHYYDLSLGEDIQRLINDRKEGKLDLVLNNSGGKKAGDGTLEIKEQILTKVKEGSKVPDVSREFGVATKTIYGWISKQATSEPGTLEMNRLRRENQELYLLVGHLTAQIERSKKRTILAVEMSESVPVTKTALAAKLGVARSTPKRSPQKTRN